MNIRTFLVVLLLVAICSMPWVLRQLAPTSSQSSIENYPQRSEVVFWHFWGGPDGDVVEDVVRRFNESQDEFFVRAVAMPGNNLQAKLFLSVAGGDPPDLINQDDPVLADWAVRGIIEPLDSFADPAEVQQVSNWMFNSARRLSTYENRLFGICNGLDIRALYYNKTALDQFGLNIPATIEQLDQAVETMTRPGTQLRTHYAYLPDSRRLWAWGFVFGGLFFDEATSEPFVDSEPIARALRWMQEYGRRYGPDNLAAFRKGDQSLPGKTFPLLPGDSSSLIGRYAMVMDGQWRVRDINAFVKNRGNKGLPAPEFGVIPLPQPAGGPPNAGWVNGNFFVVPKGAKNPRGSWEFMKFWIGYTDPAQAVKTNIDGGWIPVSQQVVNHPEFQSFLDEEPLFAKFVELAASPNQFPIPQVPGAAMFRRTVESAGYEAIMNPDRPVTEILESANQRIKAHLQRVGGRP